MFESSHLIFIASAPAFVSGLSGRLAAMMLHVSLLSFKNRRRLGVLIGAVEMVTVSCYEPVPQGRLMAQNERWGATSYEFGHGSLEVAKLPCFHLSGLGAAGPPAPVAGGVAKLRTAQKRAAFGQAVSLRV